MIARRQLLTSLASLLAAPAIVRASSLMPISVYAPFDLGAGDYTVSYWMGRDGFWKYIQVTNTYAHCYDLFKKAEPEGTALLMPRRGKAAASEVCVAQLLLPHSDAPRVARADQCLVHVSKLVTSSPSGL